MENPDGTLTVQKIEPNQREAWLEARRSGLGGSDAASVVGIKLLPNAPRWLKSQLALWAEKTGLATEPNLDELERIEWGHEFEEPIAKKYAKVTGRILVDHGRFAIRRSETHPVMHCTIDREITDFRDPNHPFPIASSGDLSIKNAGEYTVKDWEEEPPLHYQIQLQHELAVTGLEWGSFAVLIGGNKFRWCDWPRNDKFISFLIEKEEEFWDRVVRGIRPEPDASDSAKEVLSRLYPKDTGASIQLSDEAIEWAERLAKAKEEIQRAELVEQEMENKLKAAIGQNTFGVLPGGGRFSWKWQQRKSYTVAETEFRVLRRLKA